MLATLVGLYGAVALPLAALCLYGVMAQVANQRTPEIGIRRAMGAQPASVVSLLLDKDFAYWGSERRSASRLRSWGPSTAGRSYLA